MVFSSVELRREIVGLWLAFLAGQLCEFMSLVHVVWDGSGVVEEFGVNRPAVIFLPDGWTHDSSLTFLDRIPQQESLAVEANPAQAFIPVAALIGGLRGAGEPTFVNTSTVCPVSIKVLVCELDTTARMKKTSGNPVRC